VKSFYLHRGIESDDINSLIKTIGELGVFCSHVPAIVGASGMEHKPSAADLRGVINSFQLSDTVKVDARILLDALISIVPANSDLLSDLISV
jgi:hypothetical protein